MPSPRDRQAEPTDLLGCWDFDRRIVERDASGPRFGRVTGTMRFTLDGDAVDWRERGTLTWNGRELAGFRDLRVVRGDDGWTVHFDDGREFHPWRPGTEVVHPCGSDTYRGLIVVDRAGDRLRVVWDVSGPKKDCRLFTRATRTTR